MLRKEQKNKIKTGKTDAQLTYWVIIQVNRKVFDVIDDVYGENMTLLFLFVCFIRHLDIFVGTHSDSS